VASQNLKSSVNPTGYISVQLAQLTGDKTNGTIVDRKGYNGVLVLIHSSTVTTADANNYFTPKLMVGDNSALSDGAYTTDLDGSFEVINAAGDADKLWVVGYTGQKRYLRVDFDETDTADAVLGGYVILTNPIYGPGGSSNA
jgi:hypothetical protein